MYLHLTMIEENTMYRIFDSLFLLLQCDHVSVWNKLFYVKYLQLQVTVTKPQIAGHKKYPEERPAISS